MEREKRKRIEERAHRIWESEGRPDGQHDAHWDRAEREIAEEDMRSGTDASTPRPKGATTGVRASRAKPAAGATRGAGSARTGGGAAAGPGRKT